MTTRFIAARSMMMTSIAGLPVNKKAAGLLTRGIVRASPKGFACKHSRGRAQDKGGGHGCPLQTGMRCKS
jgi:hypothetical protein